VAGAFDDALEQLPDNQRPFFLLQYANQIRNKRELLKVGER
jgi:DNA-directed RNA polymerase specialized sigma24 family protein